MKDISVEYAHIYTNNHINEEHELSLKVLSELKEKESGDISLVVMVDDYSFPDPSFDYNTFTQWLSEKGYRPDIVFRESQLIPVCDEVLKLVEDKKLKEQISDYIRNKKYPCSLFISAWYLLRLGRLKSDLFDEKLVANKLVNILPESFRAFEDKAIEILDSTVHRDCTQKIENKYFKGRLMA